MAHKRHLLSRRAFLRAAAGGTGMVLLAACGGNNSSSNGSTTTAANDSGGGQRTPEQLNFQGPPTEIATEVQTGSNPTQGTGGGRTAVATQGAAPTFPVPTSFKESPELTKQVNAGKLPKVSERLPKTPMVLEPVDRVGKYGGDWNMVLVGTSLISLTIQYENLVRWKPDVKVPSVEEVMPNVAESVQIGKDGATYTFTLREGVKWSDGKPFTADDIIFWYEDVIMNDEFTPDLPSWLDVGKKRFVVKKLDDRSVSFRFSAPNGLFLANMARPLGAGPTQQPAHYLKQFHKW